MEKLRHGKQSGWPKKEPGFQKPPRQLIPEHGVGGGHYGKASDLSRAGRTRRGRPFCWTPRPGRRSRRRPAFCRSAPCRSPGPLLKEVAGGGGCSALERPFSRGPETTPSPQVRAGGARDGGGAARASRPLHFAQSRREAQKRSDLYKGSQQASGMRVSQSSAHSAGPSIPPHPAFLSPEGP